MSLLRYAIQPNIVQTTEGQPVLVHTGPFGNIAHGCCSVVSDQLALGYADYVLTEAGFGADLGFEKFMHIKARLNDLEPSAVVIVASVRALKSHGGVPIRSLDAANKEALVEGMSNLKHLIRVIKSFNLPVVVAVNSFPTDDSKETELVRSLSIEAGAEHAVVSKVYEDGGEGGLDLADAVIKAADDSPDSISYMYELSDSLEEKISSLATKVYNASGVNYTPIARRALRQFEENGWGGLPICMAKTHLSLSHNRSLKGLPSDYDFRVSDARASVGAGFIYPIAGSIMTMPGLPGEPRSLDVDPSGSILGL